MCQAHEHIHDCDIYRFRRVFTISDCQIQYIPQPLSANALRLDNQTCQPPAKF